MEVEKDTAASQHAQMKIRMPKALQEQLKSRARANVRTMSSEAVHLLQQALRMSPGESTAWTAGLKKETPRKLQQPRRQVSKTKLSIKESTWWILPK